MALDRRTGATRWATSLAGAPGTRAIAGRRHAGITADGASVVASTPLGVVARIRVDDGAIEWLRRYSVPLRDPRFAAEPWEVSAPVVADGRVLFLSPDEQEVVALDRASGRLLETRPIGPGSQWGSPRYLAASSLDDGTAVVLSIGLDIVAFRPDDLSKRLWSFVEANPTRDLAKPGLDNRAGIRGRVSPAGERALVPTLGQLLVVSLRDGRIEAAMDEQRPGNGVILSDRIVVAGDDALSVLMPPDRAERILRARLESTPDDPGAAIALFELALATGRVPLALDSARTAAAALAKGRGDAAARELTLTRLVELAAAHPEQGDDAFAIAATFAVDASLRVRMELARGDFLIASGRAADAVECWRLLAADPVLAWHLEDRGGTARAARVEAIRRMARIARRDAEISATLERRAAEAFAAATNDVARTSVVWNWPRTVAANEAVAALVAARTATAPAAAEAALLESTLPPAREDLVDRLRATLVGLEPDSAKALDRRIAELLVASGVERPVLAERPAAAPRLGAVPVDGLDLSGRLVRMTAAAAESRDPSLAFVSHEGSLARLSGIDLSKLWRHRLDDRDPTILWARERVVVWQSQAAVGESALVLDASGGTLVYSTGKTAAIWEAAGAPAPQGASQFAPDGAVFSPTRVMPHCDGESLVLVRANGSLARYSVTDAEAKPTLVAASLGQVYSSALADGLLAIAGRSLEGNEPRPTVRIYDARTLRLKQQFETATGSDVRWLLPSRTGEVAIGTIVGVERWCPAADGALHPVLITTNSDFSDSRSPIRLGASLVMLDRSDRVARVPLQEGSAEILELPGLPPSRIRTVRSLQNIAEGLLVHADDRLFMLSHAGELAGIDSTSRERNYQFAIPTAGGILQVDGLGGRQLPDRAAGTMQVEFPYVVERLSPEHGLRIEGQSFEVRCRGQRVDRMQALDGWLLFSSSMGMTAVRMPETR
ncbi:MAG: PQQ-binding-like beta-propeller repeat protein [Planctomycetaceae bacterium]|nr:PQQ-binding-like beta-propeller repeat protein [Planctomycetaceae bacterium]